MAKQAKEKENLDFFYLGEKKVEPNKSKNKNVVKSKNETKTVSPKKKSKNKKNEPMDLDNEIIIGLKRIEDKPVKKQKSTKKRNSNIKSQNSKDKNKSKIVLSIAKPDVNTDNTPIKAGSTPYVDIPNNTVRASMIITEFPEEI